METAHFSKLADTQVRIFLENLYGIHYPVVVHILAEVLACIVVDGPRDIYLVGIKSPGDLPDSYVLVKIRSFLLEELPYPAEKLLGRTASPGTASWSASSRKR